MAHKPRGAGQLIERGERTWLVRIYLGRDPETGKRKYLNKTVHGNKKDAQRVLTALLREKDMGSLVEPTRSTLGEYLDRWLETAAKPRVRERTFRDYESLLRRHVWPALGGRRLVQISPVEIQALYNDLQQQGLSARTVRYVHTVLKSALGQAVKWRLIPHNPCEHVDLPRQQRKEMQALSPEQAQRFLSIAKENKHFPLFALLIETGLRPGEALALRWSDVDFKGKSVRVNRALVPGKDGNGDATFEEPKTARSRRTVPITRGLAQALLEHKWRQEAAKQAAGSEYEDMDLVFAAENGKPIRYRNLVRRHFKPLLEKAGLPTSIRLYDLRHTCATLLLSAGEHPKVVSERLGHASITLTLDTYSHVLPDMQQAATAKLESLLFSEDGK